MVLCAAYKSNALPADDLSKAILNHCKLPKQEHGIAVCAQMTDENQDTSTFTWSLFLVLVCSCHFYSSLLTSLPCYDEHLKALVLAECQTSHFNSQQCSGNTSAKC